MFDVGDRIKVSGTFTNSTGAVIDPTVTTFEFQIDNGSVTTYIEGTDAELVKDSTGVYHVNIDPTVTGTYEYRWSGTGAAVAAQVGSFYVRVQGVV